MVVAREMATEEEVCQPSPVHEDERKLFVGALPQEAKDTDVKELSININSKCDYYSLLIIIF